MASESLAALLEREHHDIDAGVDAFLEGLDSQEADPKPMQSAMQALRRHIYLEEAFLFPPLRTSGMVAPIFVMLREHGEMWRTLDALDAELSNDPSGMSSRSLCDTLMSQMEQHNVKEERIVYPQAEKILTTAANTELRTFLDTGQLPQGWVCEQASA